MSPSPPTPTLTPTRHWPSTRPWPSTEALARAHALGGVAASQLAALLDLIAADPAAPTTVRDPAAILRDHLADSLVALELAEVRDARAIADIGSGAGLPGLALAIALPDAQVSLAESNGRKCAFVTRAIAACGARNARVAHVRVEEWTEGLGRFDLVTARALASAPVVAEYAAPLLRLGGVLVAWRGRRDADDEAAGARAAAELGLAPARVISVRPYPGARDRHLHILAKVAQTPQRFPRRAGVARKRPLGTV